MQDIYKEREKQNLKYKFSELVWDLWNWFSNQTIFKGINDITSSGKKH